MAFLKLNGIQIPVKFNSPEFKIERFADIERSMGLTPIGTVFDDKDQYELETGLLPSSIAFPLIRLLQGRGHHFDFDYDGYSNKGMPPAGSYAAHYYSSGGVFGGYLSLNGTITYNMDYDKYTVMVWERGSSTTGTFTHYALNSAGDKVEDGVVNGSMSTPFLSISNGNISLTSQISYDSFDDLVILPFELTSSQMIGVYNSSLAFSDLPKLYIAGDIADYLNSTEFYAQLGTVESEGYGRGTWHGDARKIYFTLSES